MSDGRVMNNETAIQNYRESFTSFEHALNGGASDETHVLRREAFDRFAAKGFPTMRDEDWRYTNFNPLIRQTFAAADTPATDAMLRDVTQRDAALARAMNIPDAVTLLFVNGVYAPELSDIDLIPDGIRVTSLQEHIASGTRAAANPAMADDVLARNPFAALNTAFLRDGVVIDAGRGVVAERPLHLLFFTTASAKPVMVHPRVIVRVAAQAQLDIVEQYAGADGATYFTNTLTDIRVEDGALLRHVKLQDESRSAVHVSSVYTSAGRAGTYENHAIAFGAALQRANIHGVLDGEGGHVTMNGLFLPFGTQHMDHFTTIDHAVPQCTSHELYKGVLSDDARGVFTGKIVVRQDAQKTDAVQSNNNLLLSERAQIDTRPQLEIYADDVRCTHGATVGRISAEQLFYLQSRGIDPRTAQNILTYAFAADIITRIPIISVREALDVELHRRLDASWNNR